MDANRQLQTRLESAEQKLDVQTDQISSYLTEARTDGLTGLLNRKAFDKALDGLFGNWVAQEQPFSMGMLDIDHFKQINDTYGHPAGDAVLRQVSALLQSELGQEVCVARYGGEEFAVLSLSTGEQTAAVLDRVRNLISQLQITHDAHVISVSISAGAAQIEADDKIGVLVRRADEALYAAKLGGRNRVYRYDGTMCHLVTKGATRAAEQSSLAADASQTANELSQAQAADSKIADRLQRIVEEESRRLVRR
ncbi:MAG: GGDEF domain-containing protein, partial [Planctomycetales bacterium]|nr:GGDEF domain-containing protein [Planctomycetales bacterium]